MLWFPFVCLGQDVKVIKKTDSELKQTFIFLYEQAEGVWGKDKNHLFYFHEKMKNVDISSWEILDMGYSKDKNAVYDGAVKIEGADPDTFKVPFGK